MNSNCRLFFIFLKPFKPKYLKLFFSVAMQHFNRKSGGMLRMCQINNTATDILWGNMREGHRSVIITSKCRTVVSNVQSSVHSSVAWPKSTDDSNQQCIWWAIVWRLKISASRVFPAPVHQTFKRLLLSAAYSDMTGKLSVLCKISFCNLTWKRCQICRLLSASEVFSDFTRSSPRAWATVQQPGKKSKQADGAAFLPEPGTKDLKQGHVMQDITFNPTASLWGQMIHIECICLPSSQC